MSGLRDHRIFTIQYTVVTKDAIRDSLGELVCYGGAYTSEVRTVNVVASSEALAVGWAKNRWKDADFALVGKVKAITIDAFIQEHIY